MKLEATPAPRGDLVARLQSRRIVTAAAGFSPAQLADLGAAAPQRLAQPESSDALRDLVVEAGSARGALLIVGGGTALGLGHPLARADVAVSTRGLARIVDHSPSDFVITVEAGMRLADLQRELAPHRQWLAIEPPDPERATIGGLIASAATSLVASGHGTLRNHLLGVRMLHADGRFAKAGGRVVKNVAGYDLMKLHHGALGTLGIVATATLRLRPLPAADLVAWSEVEGADAIVACADAIAQPGFVPAGAHFVGPIGKTGTRGDLVVRFQGARSAVLDQVNALVTSSAPAIGAWRKEVLEPPAAFPRPRPLAQLESVAARGEAAGTIHLSLHFPPSRLRELLAALARLGAGQVVLELARGTGFLKLAASGSTPGGLDDAAKAELQTLRREVEALGGAVALHAGPTALRGVIAPFCGSDAAARLRIAVKRELDPDGLLHPGRLGETR